ncbi:MAG: hypothetical protein Q9187_000008 [Circinaria calcarea]
MRAILPGKPQAKLQAVCTTQWIRKRLVVYISGNALIILGGPHDLIQTIYHENSDALDAVAIDEATGKIATCSGTTVYIYRPYGESERALKWSLQHTFEIEDVGRDSCALSWGTSEELLVGSSTLRLFQTTAKETLIWSRLLSSPVASALFSFDASLIASRAKYDRLVKVWRRLSFGSDDVRFDSSYLPHPSIVTGMHWRRSVDQEQHATNVLYTLCTDSKIRIWATTDPHGLQVFQLWTEIDTQMSIQPRHLGPSDQLSARFVFMIDHRDFQCGIERAKVTAASEKDQHHVLDHLAEIAQRNPEVCVVLDNKGHMCAWALENVGSKTRGNNDISNIAHVENFNALSSRTTAAKHSFVQFLGFVGEEPSDTYTLLVHHFDGWIEWLEARIDEIFDPSPRQARLRQRALWTGHDGAIKKIVRNVSGKALISRTCDNEGLFWKQRRTEHSMDIIRCSSFKMSEHIHRTCVLDNSDFVVNLHGQSISLWNVQNAISEEAASCTYQIHGKPLCLLQLPVPVSTPGLKYVATMSSTLKGIVWELQVPQPIRHPSSLAGPTSSGIREYGSFDLGLEEDLVFVLPIDPAGSTLSPPGFLDIFASDIALSYTYSGVLRTWTARVDTNSKRVEWLVTSTVVTGIDNPSLASGSSIRKIALVNAQRNGLTIWDSRSGQLEHDQQFTTQDLIGDLDWSSTPDAQSILAVGFSHRVVIYTQMRYDYIDKGPAWTAIREIDIRNSTPFPIGDSTWLGSGNLVIGAGNQLFVYDKAIATADDLISDLSIPVHKHAFVDIFDLVALLNGPLPVYHPQFLSQCILAGKMSQVQRTIISLNKILKFFNNGDDLDSYLTLSPEDYIMEQEDVSFANAKEMQSSFADFSLDDEPRVVNEALATELNQKLAKLPVPYISSREQIHLADIVECLGVGEKHRRSLDENAMRYLLFFRQDMLRQKQTSYGQPGITWREIAWAIHSESQDILVDLVSRHFQGRMLWKHARESGMFMWMTDVSALRAQFEVIARNEYTKTDEKNPVDCSLYYMALKKKNVLLGLWRMAAWNREQSSTQKLLSNNFADPRWKTAALKNAYALLGKRRFDYAAAFFLLAGNLRDAVNVCASQLQDMQLAIAVARVYEGDDGIVLRELLEDKVLPLAAVEGNRWLATWAFWMLGRRDLAVRALISPIATLLNRPLTPTKQAKSYLSTDPALVVLYRQLRDKTLLTLKGATQISPQEEWKFVLQTARLYDRMGCDLLALDLVRNWEFLKYPSPFKTLPLQATAAADSIPDPRKLLRRRSSLVVDDLPSPKSPPMGAGKGKKPPPAKVFEEPDASSLLDSFGF